MVRRVAELLEKLRGPWAAERRRDELLERVHVMSAPGLTQPAMSLAQLVGHLPSLPLRAGEFLRYANQLGVPVPEPGSFDPTMPPRIDDLRTVYRIDAAEGGGWLDDSGSRTYPEVLRAWFRNELDRGSTVYGRGGVTRYIVERDGELTFLKSSGSSRASIAQHLGFRLV